MSTTSEPTGAGLSGRLRDFVESVAFRNAIMVVIVVNAITLGMATSPMVVAASGGVLDLVDDIAITIFVTELSLKLIVYRLRFFLSPWNVFDFVIVGISILPATGNLSVLRALRIVRATRMLSVVPQMRMVVQALLTALPGMASVITVMALIFYIFAVMATRLFGEAFPQWFGTLGESLYSLFQIMTLESWSMGIVRPVMEAFPLAWILFVPFILITTFAVLNLVVGLVVNAMQQVYEAEHKDEHEAEHKDDLADHRAVVREENAALLAQIDTLHVDLVNLREELTKRR